MTVVRIYCACGCGQRIPSGSQPHRRYFSDACQDAASAYRSAAVDPAMTLGEPSKLKPSALRTLRVLNAAGTRGATTAQLCQSEIGGARFGARIRELRLLGYEIHNHRERPGSERYVLVGIREDVAA